MPKRNGVGIDLLADPTRRKLISLIAIGVGQPSKLAKEVGLSRQAVSRQLRIMARADLIRSRQGFVDRRQAFYFIEPKRLGQITAWLAGTEVGRVFQYERPWPPYQYAPRVEHPNSDDDAA